ncbi:MAG: MoaD/ThiS family protein [bacterium]|nr:MoaD/ThiS family protein [bacterium]
MITVNFYTLLRLHLKLGEIQLAGIRETTVAEILPEIEAIILKKTSKRFLFKLLDDEGQIRQGTIILINRKNVLDATGLTEIVRDGDTLALFPPG